MLHVGGADWTGLTERDKVKMSECFRLGDIVKAKVVSPEAQLGMESA
jgi:exosome complex RNA-binding protein Csl4